MSKKLKKEAHKSATIELYESHLADAGPFMTTVLTEAIRKLKESDLKTKKVENWVMTLEKKWSKI